MYEFEISLRTVSCIETYRGSPSARVPSNGFIFLSGPPISGSPPCVLVASVKVSRSVDSGGETGRRGYLRRGRHDTKVRVAIGVMTARRERAMAERRRNIMV